MKVQATLRIGKWHSHKLSWKLDSECPVEFEGAAIAGCLFDLLQCLRGGYTEPVIKEALLSLQDKVKNALADFKEVSSEI